MCSPGEGNIDAVYHIFGCLQKNLGKNPGRMEYNPMYEPTDENVFYVVGRYLYECKYFCPDAHEIMSMPIHMTEEIGKYVVI